LGPWLYRAAPPPPVGAPRALPQALVIEDDPAWADWVVACLAELRWPASVAASVPQPREALGSRGGPILVADLCLPDLEPGPADPLHGVVLIEDLAARHEGVRVIILSEYSHLDSLRSRLFEAGVRMIDVIDKAADREECRAVLLASLQRAADEMQRGV